MKRPLCVSLPLILGLCWWIAYSEIRTGTTEITCTALPIGVVFVLCALSVMNRVVERFAPRVALSPAELVTVYVLMAVGSSVAGIGMIGFLTPAIAAPAWFTNEKFSTFAGLVPRSWLPRDPEAIQAFFQGNSTLYTSNHIMAWLPPLLTWGAFLMLVLVMMLCAAIILRRQWVENERLTFPIAAVPLAMTVQSEGMGISFRNRVFLFGFLVPVVLQTINNLNWLFPSVPFIPLKPTGNGPLDIGARITSPPWNAVGYFPLAFHPNTIGLSYLLSTDVSFSCWFFFLLRKGLDVWCVAAGYRGAGASSQSARLPYTQEQGVGAWLCLAALTLWSARHHLRAVFRAVIGNRGQGTGNRTLLNDSEVLSYRLATAGFGVSFALLVGFVWWAGLPMGASLLLFGLFAAYLLALTRIRAEVGTAWHFGPYINPPETAVRMLGPMNFSPLSYAVLAYQQWYNLDYRSITVPHLFEGYKIADTARISRRKLTGAMILCAVFGIVCASWATLHLYYTYGASTAHVNSWRILMGRVGHQTMQAHLNETTLGTDWAGMGGMGVGASVMLLLNAARARFVGFPFHPAGYAVANTFIVDLLWFPFFLGWLIKVLALRYGGMKAYRAALPFFFGLILGDYVIASLWTFVGIALGIDMYRCFPN